MPIAVHKKTQGEVKKLPSAKLNLYQFKGHGIIWDRGRNKALCKFEDGRFITNDIRTIAILLKRKYKYKTKHPIAKTILEKAYNAYKKEVERA